VAADPTRSSSLLLAKVGIVFNGGQHAREWIGPMTNAYIANQLLTLYGTVRRFSLSLSLLSSLHSHAPTDFVGLVKHRTRK